MRDSHRLKEKYELSLDNRQIVSLTVASLVVLCGVFVLGVVVGKKLAREVGADGPTADLLRAVDERTAALDAVQKDASLTFQDELTKKAPPMPVAVAEPKPEPKVEPAPAPKPEPVVQAPAPIAVAEAAKPVAPAPAAKLPETPREEAVATRIRDGGLKEAFGKAQKLPQAAPSTGSGSWAVQLSAYQDRSEADRFVAGLRDKGYSPYIVEASVPNKGTWYRVRLGRFATKEAATGYLSDFKRETSMSGLVTPH